MTTLCVTTLCAHRTTILQNTEKYEFSGRMLTPPQKHQKHHDKTTILQHTEKYEFSGRMFTPQKHQHKNTTTPPKSTSVHGPDVTNNRKVRELLRKIDFSSWAGCCKSTRISTKNRLQFLGRILQSQKRQKSTSFIVKTPVKSIGEHRKVRELPRKMNIEEVEEPKKYENLQTKPVLDPFKSTAEHRKVQELPRKMNIEEVEEPETTKIYRQKPLTPVRRQAETTKNHRRNEHASTKPRK